MKRDISPQKRKQKIVLSYLSTLLLLTAGFGNKTLSANSVEKIQNKIKLEFKEIADIGIQEAKTNEEEPYQLAGVFCIDCDAEGNIYLLDHTVDCLKKFTKDGKYQKTILTKGDGPSEILNSFSFAFNRYSNTLFVLQQYGYVIKEYDLDGKSLKRYILPDQFYSLFEFIDRDRFVYISMELPSEKDDSCLKIFNIRTNTVEKKFASFKHETSFNVVKRYAFSDDVLWTSTDDLMGLSAFNLKNGNQIERLEMPGEFKKNYVKIVEEGNGYNLQQRILYNYLQPFLIDQTLYVFFTRQEYKGELGKGKSYPERSTLILYMVSDSRFQLVENFKGYDNMKFSRVRGSRILLYADEPFPRVKVIEVH